MLLADAVWLGAVAMPIYKSGIGHLMAAEPQWMAGLAFYLLYAAGLLVLVVQPASMRPRALLAKGALFGLCAYGTYDLSNLATLRGWPWTLSLVDMAWGSAISAGAAWVGGRVLRGGRVNPASASAPPRAPR
jgi:uncharacterized membrane protein